MVETDTFASAARRLQEDSHGTLHHADQIAQRSLSAHAQGHVLRGKSDREVAPEDDRKGARPDAAIDSRIPSQRDETAGDTPRADFPGSRREGPGRDLRRYGRHSR